MTSATCELFQRAERVHSVKTAPACTKIDNKSVHRKLNVLHVIIFLNTNRNHKFYLLSIRIIKACQQDHKLFLFFFFLLRQWVVHILVYLNLNFFFFFNLSFSMAFLGKNNLLWDKIIDTLLFCIASKFFIFK